MNTRAENAADRSSENPIAGTIVDLVLRNVSRNPDRIAFTFLEHGELDSSGMSTLTWAQLDRRARAIAVRLRELAEPGERIMLLCPPGFLYLEAFFGCQYAGMIAIPLYPPRLNRPLDAIQNVAQDVQARFVVTTQEIGKTLEDRLPHAPALQSMRWLLVEDLVQGEHENWTPPAIDGDSLAFFQYTSGSTGAPKGVMVRQRNLIANLGMAKLAFHTGEDTVVVTWLPLFHDFGLILMMLESVYLNAHCVLMPPMSFFQKPARWLKAVSHFRGTYCGMPNFALDICTLQVGEKDCADLDLSSLEVVVVASEACKAGTMQRFAEKFSAWGFREEAFYPGFGLAECCVYGTGLRSSATPKIYATTAEILASGELRRVENQTETSGEPVRIVSCGEPVLGGQARIVNPETLMPLPEDRVGEVWLGGPHIAKGYWNKPELSAATFQARLADSGEGPFLRTGDLGMLHDKELYITGRMKEVIIIQGQNYYPQDIEGVAQASHEALQHNSGAAFGVESEDVEQLVLVQEVKRVHRNKVDGPAVVRAVATAIASQYGIRLAGLTLIRPQTLSKTSSGKIKRNACKQEWLKRELQVIYDWRAPNLALSEHPESSMGNIASPYVDGQESAPGA